MTITNHKHAIESLTIEIEEAEKKMHGIAEELAHKRRVLEQSLDLSQRIKEFLKNQDLKTSQFNDSDFCDAVAGLVMTVCGSSVGQIPNIEIIEDNQPVGEISIVLIGRGYKAAGMLENSDSDRKSIVR